MTGSAPREDAEAPRLDRGLLLTSAVGFTLAAAIGVAILARGPHVGLEGNLYKPLEGNVSLGLLTLSSAVVLRWLPLGVTASRVWRSVLILCVAFSYVFELGRHLAGLDGRFSDFDGLWAHYARRLYFLTSQGYVFLFGYLCVQSFRTTGAGIPRAEAPDRPASHRLLGLRYGLLAMGLGFAAGYWMLLNRGRYVGAGGDILWLHGLGFHGLQIIPLLGAFAGALTGGSTRGRRALVHLGGLGWLVAGAFLTWRAARGLPVVTLDDYALVVFGASVAPALLGVSATGLAVALMGGLRASLRALLIPAPSGPTLGSTWSSARGSTSDARKEERSWSRREVALRIGGWTVVLAALTVVSLPLWPTPARDPRSPAPPRERAWIGSGTFLRPAEGDVLVRFVSSPSGAEVHSDGMLLGRTPFVRRIPGAALGLRDAPRSIAEGGAPRAAVEAAAPGQLEGETGLRRRRGPDLVTLRFRFPDGAVRTVDARLGREGRDTPVVYVTRDALPEDDAHVWYGGPR